MIEGLTLTEYNAFPTVFYEIQFDEEIIDLSRHELDMFRNSGITSYVKDYFSSFNNPPSLDVGPITNSILDNICSTISRHTKNKYVISNSWVNYVPAGCTHDIHRHGDRMMMSAVLYYDNIGKTEFFDPRIQIYNENAEIVYAEKGKCIIFNGWLYHAMPRHDKDNERVTIAFNMTRAFTDMHSIESV